MLYENTNAYTNLLYIMATTVIIAITRNTPIVTPIAVEVPSIISSMFC